jgi:hypothetical protein
VRPVRAPHEMPAGIGKTRCGFPISQEFIALHIPLRGTFHNGASHYFMPPQTAFKIMSIVSPIWKGLIGAPEFYTPAACAYGRKRAIFSNNKTYGEQMIHPRYAGRMR